MVLIEKINQILLWFLLGLIILTLVFNIWWLWFDSHLFTFSFLIKSEILQPNILMDYFVLIAGLILIIIKNRYASLLLGINSVLWIKSSIEMLYSIFTQDQLFPTFTPVLFINALVILFLGIFSIISLAFFLKLFIFKKIY